MNKMDATKVPVTVITGSADTTTTTTTTIVDDIKQYTTIRSPAAVALFAAFDNSNTNETNRTMMNDKLIHKRIQTAGWRNRYSQVEYYPYSMDDSNITFTVQQVQCGEINNTYGTGATVWPAAILLMKYLEYHATTLIHNKCIVDLGSGTAITSIACAYLNAKSIICTDGEDKVVQLAYDNIRRCCNSCCCQSESIPNYPDITNNNDTNDNIKTKKLPIITINNCPIRTEFYWWGSGSITLPNTNCNYNNNTEKNSNNTKLLVDKQDNVDVDHDDNENDNDNDNDIVIIVSDCVLPKLYPIEPLVNAINELLLTSNSIAIVSYEYRYYPYYDPKTQFIQYCTNRNLFVETISSSMYHPLYQADDIEIWHVYRTK